MKSRQKKLDDGQAYTGFTLNGVHHKPLTIAGLKFLQRIGSPLYTHDFKDYSELDIILEYLFATSATPEQLAGEWKPYEFGAAYKPADLLKSDIAGFILRDISNGSAAAVEIRGDETEKKSRPIG